MRAVKLKWKFRCQYMHVIALECKSNQHWQNLIVILTPLCQSTSREILLAQCLFPKRNCLVYWLSWLCPLFLTMQSSWWLFLFHRAIVTKCNMIPIVGSPIDGRKIQGTSSRLPTVIISQSTNLFYRHLYCCSVNCNKSRNFGRHDLLHFFVEEYVSYCV